mgnify:CR=1 FL=1|tara:strand:- start:476 stop:1489 length:1014 start_codon:yes stop_codon:yes gene_type:complete
MAVNAFAALDNILTKREARRSTDRQYALALMQFDYQKQQADMAQTGKQLELLQGANAQMMNNVAQDFISSSGLDVIYDAEDKGAENAMETLEDLGLSKRDASRVASAVWAYYTGQNPQPILKLGRKLKNLSQSESLNSEQKMFIKGLGGSIGLIGGSEIDIENAKSLLTRTDKILSNQDEIMQEVYEYGTGDFEIQRKDIGLSLSQLKNEVVEEDENDLSMPYVPSVKELVSDSKKIAQQSEDNVLEKQNALELLKDESNVLSQLQKKGTLTDEQRQYMSRIPTIMGEFENELEELNQAVIESKQSLKEDALFESQTKLSDFMETQREASGGTYRPF